MIDGRDQADRFIDEGAWEHGFDDDRGEYRTQRLVLEAWDRLLGRQGSGQFGSYGEKEC